MDSSMSWAKRNATRREVSALVRSKRALLKCSVPMKSPGASRVPSASAIAGPRYRERPTYSISPTGCKRCQSWYKGSTRSITL